MKIGFKAKILSLILLVAFVPVAISEYHIAENYADIIKNQVLENLKGVSEKVAWNFFGFLEDSGLSVLRLAERLEKTPSHGWGGALEVFVEASGFLFAGVADGGGRVVAAAGRALETARASTYTEPGSNISGTDFFTLPLAGTEYRFSESHDEKIFYTLPFEDRSASGAGSKMIMVFSKKFHGADGSTYVVYAAADWQDKAQNRLLVRLDTEFGTEGSVIYLWNSSGNLILADTNAQRVGTFLPSSAFGEAWSLYESVSRARPPNMSGLNPQAKEYVLNGQGRLAATCMAPTWFPHSLGFFAYLTNPEKIYGIIDSASKEALIFAGGLASAGVAGAFFILRGTISKINRVIYRAHKIAIGDLREEEK